MWQVQALLGRQWHPTLWFPLYGWPVRMIEEGTCGMGRVWEAPPYVVGLGVLLVE